MWGAKGVRATSGWELRAYVASCIAILVTIREYHFVTI